VQIVVFDSSISLLFIYSLSDSIKLTGYISGNVIVKSNLKLELLKKEPSDNLTAINLFTSI
jgi:hypothetical protein